MSENAFGATEFCAHHEDKCRTINSILITGYHLQIGCNPPSSSRLLASQTTNDYQLTSTGTRHLILLLLYLRRQVYFDVNSI